MAIAAIVALSGSAYAGPITGFLGIAGGITYNSVNTSGSAILDWSPSGDGGIAFVVTDATDYFNPDGAAGPLGIDVPTMLTIRDLTNDPNFDGAAPAPALAQPGPTDVPNFLSNFVDLSDATTAPISGLHFDLTELVVQSGNTCTGAETNGQSCVIGEIFVLTQTENGLRINLDVLGYFRAFNTATQTNDEGYYKGAFSTTFTDLTILEALMRIDAGLDLDCPTGNNGGRTSCTMDGNFTNAQPIPEPASLLLFGTGSTLLALRRRRNKK